jgi:signal transduction histidine kinase
MMLARIVTGQIQLGKKEVRTPIATGAVVVVVVIVVVAVVVVVATSEMVEANNGFGMSHRIEQDGKGKV